MSARRMAGLTLVELMVAITVGLIMMNVVLQVYLGSRQSYLTQEAVSRIQENGRLAVEFLTRDARMVGYMGCLTGKELNAQSYLNVVVDPNAPAFDFDNLIRGYDVADPNDVPGVDDAQPGTDALVLRMAVGDGMFVDESHNSDANLAVTQVSRVTDGCEANKDSFNGLCDGDILMLSNCSRVLVFKATNVQATGGGDTGDPINLVHSDGNDNDPVAWNASTGIVVRPGEELLKMQQVVYYIRESDRTGRPGLFRKVGDATPVELIEDVQSMQLRYGVDTNGDRMIDAYEDADDVADWASVIAIRMQLLLQTPETNVLPEAQDGLAFNGVDIDTADRRLRQVFTATVALRNRMAE